ncbi:type VII secretion protein EccCa [Kineosporia sp. J2-2]|uniref:Type VII secretion protein EccCa n=1 Tax=Kineosporia corallincola TaxID=2835133 RepID=A0ABS5TBB2_9ACTN|nr:type VII secretion protein EccCa [Kineosporia corallincola]MBT0768128.1 type VII secretion protein EccCa [Kineosporia corallincola]
MGTVVVKRAARRPEPEYPSGEIVLEAPPEIPAADGRAWQQMVMVLPMLAGSAAMVLIYTSGGRSSGPLMYVAGGLFGLSAIGMLGSQMMFSSSRTKQGMRTARQEYMRYLSQQRARVRRVIVQQRRALHYRYPAPDSLWSLPEGPRLWERRPGDGDFGMIRIGVGPQELATALIPPQTKPLDQLEPMCAAALRRFIRSYAVVPELPVVMALDGFSRVHVRGDGERARSMVRALVAQAVVMHAPDDLVVAVSAAPERRADWEFVKWLPHAQHPQRTDALGPLRLIADSVTGLEAMLDDIVGRRPRFDPSTASGRVGQHVVVVLDGGGVAGSDHLMTDGGIEGVTVFDLRGEVPRVLDYATLVLDVEADGGLRSTTLNATSEMGVADTLGPAEAEALAMQLAPLRMTRAARGDAALATDIGLADLLGIGDPGQLDTAVTWQPRPSRDRLRVPIGVSPEGIQTDLDLKESALEGMGPHGLLIGATGSGKSELLRTLVLALAATHDSQVLNFVLIDFKGGATFTKLDRLPHTSAVITNLVDELPLVDRMTDAINGELLRRQELLRAAGNFESQREYERVRISGAPLPPLPSLLIVCDEFSELLSAKPDFIEMFVQIGRLGRSLGVHLLLASQRLEEGRLRGLDTHLSYRIALRTFSAMESRIAIGTSDAFELPRSPGHGYIKFGTDPLMRFRAAFVSGAYRRDETGPIAVSSTAVMDFTSQYTRLTEPLEAEQETPEPDDEAGGEKLLDVMVGRLEGRGEPAHQVWLPPLGDSPTLGELLPGISAHPRRGLTAAGVAPGLVARLGIVDRPFEQRRDVLEIDLAGSGGHVVVVGGPRSGKSTMLRDLVLSLALTHTPDETQFYVLDFGGSTFAALAGLPHVGGVSGRLEVNKVRRTVAEVMAVLVERERLFARIGVESMAEYRRMRADGRAVDDRFGDVFLVVDGWATVRSDYEDLEAVITQIAARGLTYGVHLVVGASRWMEMRPAARDMFGSRLELRLGDIADSMLDRRTAMNVPEGIPGRGITPDRFHFLTALPVLDAAQGVAETVAAIARHWPGQAAPPVRLLPAEFPYKELEPAGPGGIPIGVAETDLGVVRLDLDSDPHFLLYGDSRSGKTAFLRAFGRALTERHGPEEARIVVIDHRRSLLGAITEPHLIGYGTGASRSEEILAEVAQALRTRLPGPDVTADQLRNRSWWKGPELYVLVDDYDLVATASGNPLTLLQEFLGQARDVGLHVIIARRSGGAGRALYEPVTMALREIGSAGVLLSGQRDEGALLGNVRPSPQPPGRGWLVDRARGTQLVQLAWLPPPE